jgi:hypothetical protein
MVDQPAGRGDGPNKYKIDGERVKVNEGVEE